MATYTLNWQSQINNDPLAIPSKTTISLPELTINAFSTTLPLTGRGNENYGQTQQENFIRLLENFASSSPPANATIGQLWYNPVNNISSDLTNPGVLAYYSGIGADAGQPGWTPVVNFASLSQAQAGASTTTVINPFTLNTILGSIQGLQIPLFATQAEATAGTSTNTIISPETLVTTATNIANAGISATVPSMISAQVPAIVLSTIPYATQAEANAGLSTTEVINPATLVSAIQTLAPSLPFTPVEQGGGAGQGTNKLNIGWSATGLLLQVDATTYGNEWPINIAAAASKLGSGADVNQPMIFTYSAIAGTPTYLWGSSSSAGQNNNVYAAANLSVGYATTATTATNGGVTSVNGLTGAVSFPYLAAASESLAVNGYCRLSNGLTFQWGTGNLPGASGSNTSITFPTPFTSACFNVQVTIAGAPGLSGDNGPFTAQSFNTTTLTVYSTNDTGGANFHWFATGV
jgi:hypothetical protein